MFKLYGSKTCLHCGVEFHRTRSKGADWSKRKYCSRSCSALANVPRGKKTYDGPLNTCQICGVNIVPKPGKGAFDYALRRTCGKACGYKMGAMTRAAK